MISALSAIERIRNGSPSADEPVASCEMCSRPIGTEGDGGHAHIVDTGTRSLLCACRPCALLFDRGGAGGGRYRRVPDRWLKVAGFSVESPAWAGLQIPVGVVFVLRSSTAGGPVAFYPGPAGATESLLDLDAWTGLVAEYPELASIDEDVEAALVLGREGAYVVPVDACYELVGRLRRVWRGFDGGSEARSEMEDFATSVRGRAGADG